MCPFGTWSTVGRARKMNCCHATSAEGTHVRRRPGDRPGCVLPGAAGTYPDRRLLRALWIVVDPGRYRLGEGRSIDHRGRRVPVRGRLTSSVDPADPLPPRPCRLGTPTGADLGLSGLRPPRRAAARQWRLRSDHEVRRPARPLAHPAPDARHGAAYFVIAAK